MFDDIYPYLLGAMLAAVLGFSIYEFYARKTGKLYTPRHARENQRKLLRTGEHLVLKLVYPDKDADDEIPATPIRSILELHQFNRVRGALSVKTQDIYDGRINTDLLLQMIFARAKAADIHIEVETYRDEQENTYIVRWHPIKAGNTEVDPGNIDPKE